MSEFAAGFRTHGLRTAIQVRHTVFSFREKKDKKMADSYSKVSKKLGYFTVFRDHAMGLRRGGGREDTLPHWKQRYKGEY